MSEHLVDGVEAGDVAAGVSLAGQAGTVVLNHLLVDVLLRLLQFILGQWEPHLQRENGTYLRSAVYKTSFQRAD